MAVPPATDGDVGMPEPAGLDPDSSDEELVHAIRDRRPEALDLLYARYGRPVFALARRVTGDEGFAEDVAQEVFLTLWHNPNRFDRSRGGFASWLLSVTHHKAVDAVRREESLRRRRTQVAEEAATAPDSPPVDEEVFALVRRDRVREALRALPPTQRQALALAYFGGYTQREVAALTGAPLGTVKTRMLAGMRRLSHLLQDAVNVEGEAR